MTTASTLFCVFFFVAFLLSRPSFLVQRFSSRTKRFFPAVVVGVVVVVVVVEMRGLATSCRESSGHDAAFKGESL